MPQFTLKEPANHFEQRKMGGIAEDEYPASASGSSDLLNHVPLAREAEDGWE